MKRAFDLFADPRLLRYGLASAMALAVDVALYVLMLAVGRVARRGRCGGL